MASDMLSKFRNVIGNRKDCVVGQADYALTDETEKAMMSKVV